MPPPHSSNLTLATIDKKVKEIEGKQKVKNMIKPLSRWCPFPIGDINRKTLSSTKTLHKKFNSGPKKPQWQIYPRKLLKELVLPKKLWKSWQINLKSGQDNFPQKLNVRTGVGKKERLKNVETKPQLIPVSSVIRVSRFIVSAFLLLPASSILSSWLSTLRPD